MARDFKKIDRDQVDRILRKIEDELLEKAETFPVLSGKSSGPACFILTLGFIATHRFHFPKYKLGSHRAIPGNSITITSPTIITSTKGVIER